jgi:hypothetical protein
VNAFFFTFGTGDEYPFYGGWVKVLADNEGAAREKYRARFPDRNKDTLNCAFVYDEAEFVKTKMAKGGNYGFYCHEVVE